MALFISSLNSGSNGNCYYVGNEEEAILVDAGISCREVEKRMSRIGLCPSRLKAVFVSHEHSDHIRGIPSIAKKFNLPVYITPPAIKGSRLYIDRGLVQSFRAYEPVHIGGLRITAFPKFHDASDPYSFVVACGDVTVGIFTDIGTPCENLIRHFSQCHAAFLESNYDEEMLEKGSYPYFLKQRIRGGQGHLSNRQALALFQAHRPSFMTHLLLSHLSQNNNCPDLVQRLFDEGADGVEMIVASRYRETPVYAIGRDVVSQPVLPVQIVQAPQLAFAFE